MLNEVLRLTQGDLSNVTQKDNFVPFDAYNPPLHLNTIKIVVEKQDETERNNEAFYKDYQGECNV